MIPVNEPSIGESEIAYVLDCMRTGWISSSGRYIEAFESTWAAYCGRKFGVAVSNGTVALEIAVRCLDLKPGDEVILPSFTIVSCVQAIIYAGGVPVLVDSDPRTWCMDVSLVEAKVTPRTRAIMPVHIYGHPVDMDPILYLADRYGLAVIEDAAEAHGAEYFSGRAKDSFRWRRCGSFGLMSCFSFYANKIITTGEGGMVLTDDPDLAQRLRSLRNLCFQMERRFFHEELGYNFRLTNLQAAIGLAQFERIEELIRWKRRMAAAYTERLCDLGGIQLPAQEPWARNVYWMYGIVLDGSIGLDAAELARRLREMGVETRPFFLGMHEQPVLRAKGYFRGECYPIADRLARYGLYLPSGMTLTETQIEEVCEAVRSNLNPGKDH